MGVAYGFGPPERLAPRCAANEVTGEYRMGTAGRRVCVTEYLHFRRSLPIVPAADHGIPVRPSDTVRDDQIAFNQVRNSSWQASQKQSRSAEYTVHSFHTS